MRLITFTQGHPDHVGGWSLFNADGVETIAQANHGDVREYWRHLHPFYVRRIMALWGAFMDVETHGGPAAAGAGAHIRHSSKPRRSNSADASSSCTPPRAGRPPTHSWCGCPRHRTVFIGNLMGPFFGHVPNLYTLRGDKIRSAMAFIHSLDRVIALAPETLFNGHDVFRGADQIQTTMTTVRDATAYLRDRTIDGMNSGADLWALMRDVTLPVRALAASGAREGAVDRAGDLGGARRLVPIRIHHRALRRPPVVGLVRHRRTGRRHRPRSSSGPHSHAEGGRPLQALHLTDIVLAHSPGRADALRVKQAALQQLLVASGRENHSEVQWLEQEIKSATTQGDA